MVIINNQKGYTLILVMIIISVIMILAAALSGATLNARKQLNLTDNHNKATDLAEMGITHYLEVIKGLIGEAEAEMVTKSHILDTSVFQASQLTGKELDDIMAQIDVNYKPNFCQQFTDLYDSKINNTPIKVDVENKNQYEIIPTGLEACSDSNKTALVHFKSNGKTAGPEDSVNINGTFKITQLTNNENQPEESTLSDLDIGIITKLAEQGKSLSDLKDLQSLISVLLTLEGNLDLSKLDLTKLDLTKIDLSKLGISIFELPNLIGNLPLLKDLIDIVINLGFNLDLSKLNDEVSHLLSITEIQDNTKLNGNKINPFPNSVILQNLTVDGGSALVVKGDTMIKNLTINGTPPNEIKLFAMGNVYLSNIIKNGIKPINVCVLGDIYILNGDKKSEPPLGLLNNKCKEEHWDINTNDGIEVNY